MAPATVRQPRLAPVAHVRTEAHAAAQRKPHVCFVAPTAWPVFSGDPDIKVVGGAELQQSILARLLAASGYRVSMVCCDYGQPSPALIDGVSVYKAFRPDAGLPVVRFVHPRLSSMWRLLRSIDADVYYQRSAALWTAVVAEFCRHHGKRSIYAAASDSDFQAGRELIRYRRDRWLYRHGLGRVDRIVVQNEYQLELCRREYAREAVLIPSCYSPPPHARRTRGEVVLWVGTLHPHKRPDWLLAMAAKLPERRFVMIGGPSSGGERLSPGFYESIRAQAAKLPNVEFLGFQPLAQTELWFDRARALVSTSVYEGMPNVFLQAWARGVPTVATVDVGSPAIRTFKTVEEGTQCLEALLADEQAWARASAASLAHFQANHSATEVLARYGRLLDELAS